MSGGSRLKVNLARLMILKIVALLIGQTCGSMQHVEQESLELGTCCTCIEGICTSTAGVPTAVGTTLEQCLLHAAQITPST